MASRDVRMYNPSHRFDTGLLAGPATEPVVAWSHEFLSEVIEVAVWDDTVYCTTRGGAINALGIDGTPLWRFETGWARSSPAAVEGTLYIGGGDCIYALDVANGTQCWAFETDGMIYSSPAVVDKTIYVTSTDSNIYALDAESGTQRWASETDDVLTSSPTVVEGTVYFSGQNQVYALDAASGNQRWAFENDGICDSSLAVVEKTVYVRGVNYLYAIDAAFGSEYWSLEIDKSVKGFVSSPAVVNGTVYVGSNSGHVYALDTNHGAKQWTFETEAKVLSLPVVDGTVYIGSSDNHVYALSSESGTQTSRANSEETGTQVFESAGASDKTDLDKDSPSTTFCPSCGDDLSEFGDAAFCPSCGVELPTTGE